MAGSSQELVDILATVVEDEQEVVENNSEYQDQDYLNCLISEENESSYEEVNKLEQDFQISKHHLISQQRKLDNGLYDRLE